MNADRWDDTSDFIADLEAFRKLAEIEFKNPIPPPWFMGPKQYEYHKKHGHVDIKDGVEYIFGHKVIALNSI